MVAALVVPRSVRVNCLVPVLNPFGSITTTYDPFNPVTPNNGPTFSTGKFVPDACTDTIDELGFCCCASPRSEVNKIMRVCPSALKL